MNRKITEKETKQLFLFCQKRYVYHYDLQIELVDHLASAIEEQWKIDSELTFNEALKKSFAKFGTYGFNRIKKQKEKELRRKYNRLLWKYFLEFYKLPKVIMTFAFTIALFFIFQIVDSSIWIILSYLGLLMSAAIVYYLIVRPKNKIKVVPWKSFMLIDYLQRVGNLVAFINLPIIGFNLYNTIGKVNIDNNWILSGVSFFMVAFCVLLYGQFVFIPKKIKEHFMANFAEFAV